MSAITGIFHLNGKPVEASQIEEMKAPISQWGPEVSSAWIEGNTGLGHLLSYNTPEALHEKQPLTDTSGRYVLVSRARIDNRDELKNELGIPGNEMATTPDSVFILAAFKKWGKDCVHHLLGDWAFAIYDKMKQELFIARDHHGNTGLFWFRSSDVFVFGSSIKSLLANGDVSKEINDLFVTKILVSWPPLGHETAYSRIFRLPPAHYLLISKESFEVKRYWYLENTPELHLSSPSAYYEHFLEVFTNAVKVRLRSYKPVASTLSGGLDSGSVSALAASELKKQNQRLQCYCAVPLYDISQLDLGRNRFGDEGFLAEETAKFSGNIDLEKITSADISILDSIRLQLATHMEPAHAAGNYHWIAAILKQARASGYGTLLTGQGGNATISWTGLPDPPTLTSVMKKLRSKKISRAAALRQIIKMLLPDFLVQQYLHFKDEKNPWEKYSAINSGYAAKINLNSLMKKAGHDPHFRRPEDAKTARLNILKPGKSLVGSFWQSSGGEHGIEVRDPSFDKKLMELCFAIPDRIYKDETGDRLLIRNAMASFLPDNVRLNKKRGLQASDLVYSVRENADELNNLISTFNSNEQIRSYLDISKMENILKQSQHETEKNKTAEVGTIFLRGAGVGLFIIEFSTIKKNHGD
mgnify:CR=1 FL=1